MKKFIFTEFEREKVSHNFLPEKQVALAVIHRYNSYIASSSNKARLAAAIPRKIPRGKSPKLGRKVSKLVKLGAKKPSVGDSGFLEQTETDSDEVDIQEFDEDIPVKGIFSIIPSSSRKRSTKQKLQLLVRYNSDSDTDNISDSSPYKTVNSSPVMPEMMRKVAMCGPVLPCLTSSSLDQPGQTSVDWQIGEAAPAPDLVEQVCEGDACGWCLAMPGPSQLQLCSACSSVAYCGTICQGESWPSHKRVCKKMKGASWMQKVELVGNMIQLARSRKDRRKPFKSTAGKQDVTKDPNPDVVTKSSRTVQFSSQPQFEPSQPETVPAAAAPAAGQPKSILRK